jgi:hypothetical protein
MPCYEKSDWSEGGGEVLLEQLPRADAMFGSRFYNEGLKNITRVAHKKCVRECLEVMRISVAGKSTCPESSNWQHCGRRLVY